MDLIVCWPDSCDYPLWRAFIKVERRKFKKVIIVWTKSNQGRSYKDFVEMAMDGEGITFVESPALKGGDDWRNIAVNAGLEVSTAPWVWFTEQDVFILDSKFWVDIVMKIRDKDAVLYQDDSGRIHPCMAFVKRSAINKTKRDFSVVKDKSDHFSIFFGQLKLSGINISWVKHKYFYHMNGLSHNMTLLERGEPITYDEAGFKEYLQMCLNEDIQMECGLDDHFIEVVKGYL